MKTILCLLLFIILFLQFGCGPSNKDVLKQYEATFREKREQLKRIADSLPPKDSINNSLACKALSPNILIDEKSNQFNTESLMFEQLLDPDAKPEMDFLMNGDLLNSIQWTGPKNPLSDSVKGNNGKDMENTLVGALNYRYLIVHRVKDLLKPSVKDETTYQQGQITTESFIVDLTNNKTLCGFTTTAKSLEDITQVELNTGSRRGTRQPAVIEQLRKAVKSSLWENARKQVANELKNSSNALITLEFE